MSVREPDDHGPDPVCRSPGVVVETHLGLPCDRPRRRPTGQRPRGLTGRTERDVLQRGEHLDGDPEHRGRDLRHRPRAAAAADQQRPARCHPLRDEGVDAVGQPAEHPLHGGPREVLAGRVRAGQADVASARVGPVGRSRRLA